jgi:transcriptional regulator with XRE-family HTH domain/ribosomal protein L12E/L44/L45/RPP1/RPP2
MKEQIGEKIRRLRKEKRLTQENLHHNQSQVALIEKGTKKGGISNPTEDTLRIIAGNMDMTFESLIDETTWMKPESTLKSKEIAFSPAYFNINIDDLLNLQWSNRSFPLYNEKGEKNEYCPYSGFKLIDKCEKCGRSVEKTDQAHCFGCGELLFFEYALPAFLSEILSDHNTISIYEVCQDSINDIDIAIIKNKELLQWIEIIGKSENPKELIKEWESLQPSVRRKGTFAFTSAAERILESVFSEAKKGNKPGIQSYCLVSFIIQACEAAIMKLKSVIKDLNRPTRDELIENERYNIKSDILLAVAVKIEKSLNDPNITIDPITLIGMMKDLSSDGDIEEVLNNIKPKIDSNTKSENEKISEDGNSETDAAENADRNNKNAENKKDKESKNE